MPTLRLIGLTALVLVGCSSNSTHLNEAPPPTYDADAIAKAAFAELDRNGNGTIEAGEASASPALAAAFAEFDINKDRKLTLEEVKMRVNDYAKAGTGSVAVGCTVKIDDKPIQGATVTFIPEPFMGSAFKPAIGKTDEAGRCDVYEIDGKPFRGLSAGLYRIQVTKDGMNIPARYNTQTTLGREVFPNPRLGEVTIELLLLSR
jgi:hypothetical protein